MLYRKQDLAKVEGELMELSGWPGPLPVYKPTPAALGYGRRIHR